MNMNKVKNKVLVDALYGMTKAFEDMVINNECDDTQRYAYQQAKAALEVATKNFGE